MTVQHINGRDVVVMDRLSSPTQDDVQIFIRKLYASLLSYGLYPPGHTMISKRIQELHQHIQKMFLESSLLVVVCEQDLVVNKIRILRNVPEKDASVKSASYLGLRGVKNVVLWPQVSNNDMQALFQTWHSINEEEEEEAFERIHRFHSPCIRMNMELVSSTDWDLKNQSSPVAISKQELAEILSQIGPQGTGQFPHVQSHMQAAQAASESSPPSHRPTANIHLVGSMEPSEQNRGFSGRMADPSGESSPSGHRGMVQAQQVLQHVGGQVVQAQQVIQQYHGVVGHPPPPGTDFSGMIYPPPHPESSESPVSSGTPISPEVDYFGNPIAHPSPPHGTWQPGAEAFGQDLEKTNLPPGLREPAAYHPARQAPPVAGGMFERMEYGGPQRPIALGEDGDTALQSFVPPPAQPAGLRVPGAMGLEPFRITEITPSVADLPEIQGHFWEQEEKTAPGWKMGNVPTEPSPWNRGNMPTEPPVSLGSNPSSFPLPNPWPGAVARPETPGRPDTMAKPSSAVDWVRADPVSLDQSQLDISQLDFGKIDPDSLFHSHRFREFLQQGGIGLYLSRFLSSIMSRSPVGRDGHLAVVQSEGGWLGMQEGQALMAAVDQVTDPGLQQKMIASLAETISSTIPELIDEQMAHLGTSVGERLLRKEVLQQIPQNWHPTVGQLLLQRLQQTHHPAQIDGLMTTLSMIAEEQLETEGWKMLVPTLETLSQQVEKYTNHPELSERIAHWQELLTSPHAGRVLFQQLLHHPSPDHQKLAERGILAMKSASAYNFTLFLELANDPHREQTLLQLIPKVGGQLDAVEQTLFFEQIWDAGLTLPKDRHLRLCRTIYTVRPDLIEKYLADQLDTIEKAEEGQVMSSDWAHWAQLAVSCHTPRLRQYLGRYLQNRKLLEWPELEAKILALLDSHGTVQGFQFLEHIIHNQRHPNTWKVTAVWLLGSLRTEEALLLLRRILLERKRFLRQPIYSQDLRWQALQALQFFPPRQVMELVKKISQESDELLRQQAQKMLDVWAEQA